MQVPDPPQPVFNPVNLNVTAWIYTLSLRSLAIRLVRIRKVQSQMKSARVLLSVDHIFALWSLMIPQASLRTCRIPSQRYFYVRRTCPPLIKLIVRVDFTITILSARLSAFSGFEFPQPARKPDAVTIASSHVLCNIVTR